MTGYKSKKAAAQAFAQPVQEPVAFVNGRGWRSGNLGVIPEKMNQIFEIYQPLYTTPPQPAQEPWCMKMNGCKTKCEDCPDEAALAQPAQDAVALRREYQSGYYDGKQAALAGREWNFCERCGKRTADLTVIHTCTPPQENT